MTLTPTMKGNTLLYAVLIGTALCTFYSFNELGRISEQRVQRELSFASDAPAGQFKPWSPLRCPLMNANTSSAQAH